jgi:hypothetical protein
VAFGLRLFCNFAVQFDETAMRRVTTNDFEQGDWVEYSRQR